MQRLQLNPDEKLTIKEYLKRKKKQAKKLKKRSKITYIMIGVIIFLFIYICTQFYVYSGGKNYTYTESDGLNKQNIYNIYYVLEGYTYNPMYSLSSINSDGFNDKTVYSNSGLVDIQATKDYIYGLKGSSLCRFPKKTNELEVLIEKDVIKYKISENRIYYISESDSKLKYINLENKEIKDLAVNNVSEILIDSESVYFVKDQKTQKNLLKFDKEGQNQKELTTTSNVSYIIQDEKSIYFVNKKDGNKIYKVGKDDSSETKLEDVSSISDKGDIKEIDGSKYMFINAENLYYINIEDGNTLWKINLSNKEKSKIISVPIEILQNVDKTCYYKVKNEMGVYLFNVETNFMSQVTKRKIKEFFVDQTDKIETKTNKNSQLNKT